MRLPFLTFYLKYYENMWINQTRSEKTQTTEKNRWQQHVTHSLAPSLESRYMRAFVQTVHTAKCFMGGVPAQRAQRGRSAQLYITFPATALKTTHRQGSYIHRVKTADLDSNIAFLVAHIVCLTNHLSFWTEEESEHSCVWNTVVTAVTLALGGKWVQNSLLFAQCGHSTGTAHGAPPCTRGVSWMLCAWSEHLQNPLMHQERDTENEEVV